MKVYLDTNVYRHISEADDPEAIRSHMRALRWQIVASGNNLFEAFAIKDPLTRDRELRTLARLANGFESVPHSYLEAMQVMHAFRRHRPEWIRRVVFDRSSRRLLDAHQRHWREAKLGIYSDAGSWSLFADVFETGNAAMMGAQRTLRRAMLENKVAIFAKQFGVTAGAVHADLASPAGFWRAECWFAYDAALRQRQPAMRDLFDWLSPRLKSERINAEELFLFWMQEVEATEVPIAHWTALVSWGQLHAKTSHGNAFDLQHSAMALITDLFVTADESFYKSLQEARSHFSARLANVVLWPRGQKPIDALLTVNEDCRP